ncbi:MAG: TIGR04279 domain-containing protein [Methanosarcina sp.]|uniref:TIGR04279 domain-containing protein n=1 Tax=Methanosarcina sp. TaxID=2213 RepID=UPI002616CEC2|nr:TIGR04279 domain-containing protein [Methanosarcina sp.]MDD3245376.1 TIGR04279 domain-containing protein [Methanosarcina sp.]MDD4249083.1 TIGR04279 domain-containing protein [Methanosarcina sp.]
MKKRTGTHNGIYGRIFRLTLTVLIITFSFISVSAAFSEKEPWIAVIEKNDNSIFFADHNESLTEGGWIRLSGGNEIQLPQPLNFTYRGTDSLKSAGTVLELKSRAYPGTDTELVLTYPYSTHPFYAENEKVKMDFKGPEAFGKQKVNIYLIEGLNVNSLKEAFTDIRDGNALSFKEIFDNSTDSTTLVTTAVLDENGDLSSPLTLDPLPAGSYGVLIMLAGNENEEPEAERKVLSATCFEVMKYKLEVGFPKKIKEGENLEVNLKLKKAPAQGTYTYGALLIKEEAYRAEINVSSNGTVNGTDIFVNGIDIINEFGINSTNYESKFSKNELTTEIQTMIGEGNGTISIGEENQNTLSLTTFDLPPGDYLLFAAAYENGKGLASITQKEMTIREDKKSNGPYKKQESKNNLATESKSPSTMETEQPILDTVSSLRLDDLEPQIRGNIPQAAEIMKNPPKLASFIIGFLGTLTIGISILK